MTTGDAICDRIIAQGRSKGMTFSDDFVRLLAKPIAEANEFERLLRMPIKGGSVQVARLSDTLDAFDGVKTLAHGEKEAEILLRSERLKTLAGGLRGFARAAAGGFILGELSVSVVDLLGQLWRFYNPTDIDPDKYRAAGCGGGLEGCGGIWRQDAAEAILDLLEAYEQDVKDVWERIQGKTLVPGVVRLFWDQMQPEYFSAAFGFSSALKNSVNASRFGPGNIRQTRNGVHPR